MKAGGIITRHWNLGPVLLVMVAILAFPWPAASAPPAERHFRIEASSFEYSPATVAVNPGDRVTLELVSTDVIHGIYIDGYELEVAAEPGQTEMLSFVADRSGTFRMRCSVTCGALHPFMIGKLIVGQNTLLWKSLAAGIFAALVGLWSALR